ncbi:MAG: hypothetical protein VX899_15545 [Myxococcota bacterium]|nr:hypothetical protein [Myxococcota bacterium]
MSFSWDPDNRRFVTVTRCPWPGCGAPAEPFHQGGLQGWCPRCERPYATSLEPPSQGGAPVEWSLCPTSLFHTFTGRRLEGYSPVDWPEASGGPERSGCADDPRGSVFGAPNPLHGWGLEEAWTLPSIAPQEQNRVGDAVAAVAVMRGRVLAVSARGRMSLVEPFTGELLSQRPIDWPGFPTPDADHPVAFTPVVRGSRVVLASALQLLFRDLASQLGAGPNQGTESWRVVGPESPERRFVGPPLGLDTPEGPKVAVLEADAESRQGLANPVLRFFTLDGQELTQCPVQGIVRPPVFDRRSQQLLWLDAAGFLHRLPADDLSLPLPALPTDPLLPLSPSLHPTFALAENARGDTELWVGRVDRQGVLELCRCDLQEAESRGELRWVRRKVGVRGALLALSVGRGPHHRQNLAGQLLAVSTDQGVFSFPKDLIDAMEHGAARGHETADLRGSWDAPVICSAGVLARVQGRVQLLEQGLPWGRSQRPSVALPVRYPRPQGLALYGRLLIMGVSMGLQALRIVPEGRP